MSTVTIYKLENEQGLVYYGSTKNKNYKKRLYTDKTKLLVKQLFVCKVSISKVDEVSQEDAREVLNNYSRQENCVNKIIPSPELLISESKAKYYRKISTRKRNNSPRYRIFKFQLKWINFMFNNKQQKGEWKERPTTSGTFFSYQKKLIRHTKYWRKLFLLSRKGEIDLQCMKYRRERKKNKPPTRPPPTVISVDLFNDLINNT